MKNMYDIPAGGHASAPAGAPDPTAPYFSARARKKWLFRWGAGITLAGFLAGGAIALAAVSGSPASTASSSAASATQAAELNSALNTAGSPAATVPERRIRWALGRLRALGGVHGEFTFHGKTGYHTLAFERGTIASVSGSDVVIKAPDGTTWTWVMVSDTVVRKAGSKTTTSALTAGETVFAAGPEVNGAKDARLIVISAAASSGSGSAQTSLS
jgi:hypothetical protein